jgi:16S rRNA processing protein RimM
MKTQGRRGEVSVEVHSDAPERFHEGLELFALAPDGSRRDLRLQELWSHNNYLVLKFAGIDSISDAETLVGCELQIPFSERAKLGTGWAYVSDLIGCAVFDGDRQIGQVNDVKFGAGEAPLLAVRKGSEVYEIPYAEAYLVSVDLEHKQIRMQLPEGMLGLNGPLTEEEKSQQRKRTGSA